MLNLKSTTSNFRKRNGDVMKSSEKPSRLSGNDSKPVIQTRSVERVLAPIAAQVSQLIILNETFEEEEGKLPNLVPFAQTVLRATEDLVQTGRRLLQDTDDEKLQKEMPDVCDAGIAVGRSMLMAVQRFQADPTSQPARENMVTAARRLLETTMKILLISDAAEVRRILDDCEWVLESLEDIRNVRSIKDLVAVFREFSDSVLLLCDRCDRRQQDLTDRDKKEKIRSSLAELKSAMPMLNSTMQTYVKYPANVQAKASRDYACKQVGDAVHLIQAALQESTNKSYSEDSKATDRPGYFALSVEKLISLLSPQQRLKLDNDFESLVQQTVRHGMSVATESKEEIKEEIVHICKQVLQLKSEVLEHQQTVRAKPSSRELMTYYQEACEGLAEAVLSLENSVKTALVHGVVDVFTESTEHLDRMIKTAMVRIKEKGPISEDICHRLLQPLDDTFHDHSDRILQIASFIAASCVDSNCGQEILSIVSKLEELDSEVFPSCLAVRQNLRNRGAVEHLKLVRREWHSCIHQLVDAVDDIIDVEKFMEATESHLESDVENCRHAGLVSDGDLLPESVGKILGRCRRLLHVAKKYQDKSNDAVYRNGLQVFIGHIENAIPLVKNGTHYTMENVDNKRAWSALMEHCRHLLQCVHRLYQGLDQANHPDIMSPLRRSGQRSQLQDNETLHLTLHHPTPKEETSFSPILKMDYSDTIHHQSRLLHNLTIHDQTTSSHWTKPKAALKSASSSSFLEGFPNVSTLEDNSAERWPLPSKKITKDMVHKLEMAYPMNELVRALFTGESGQVTALCQQTKSRVEGFFPLVHRMKKLQLDGDKIRSLEDGVSRVQGSTLDLLHHCETCIRDKGVEKADAIIRAEAWSSRVTNIMAELRGLVDWCSVSNNQHDVVTSTKDDAMRLISVAIEMKEVLRSLDRENQPTHDMHIQQVKTRASYFTKTTSSINSLCNQLSMNKGDRALMAESETVGLHWAVGVLELLHTVDDIFLGPPGSQQALTMVAALSSGRESDVMLEVKRLNTVYRELTGLASKALNGADASRQMAVTHALKELEGSTSRLATASISMAAHTGNTSSAATAFSLLKIGLLQREWILKSQMVECELDSLVVEMLTPLDRLTGLALAAGQAKGSSRQQIVEEFQRHASGVCEAVMKLKRDCSALLRDVSNLPDKSVILECMDALANITPRVVAKLGDITDGSTMSLSDGVKRQKREWACNVKAFIHAINGLPGVDPALKQDMKDALLQDMSAQNASFRAKDGASVASPVAFPRLTPEQWRLIHTLSQQGLSLSDMQSGAVSPYPQGDQTSHISSAFNTPREATRSPRYGAKSFHDVSPQRLHSLNQSHVKNASLKADLDELQTPGSKTSPSSPAGPYRSRPLGINDTPRLLKLKSVSTSSLHSNDSAALSDSGSAPYSNSITTAALALQQETDRWEEERNDIVRIARVMAQQMRVLAKFARRHSCIEDKDKLVATAKSIAANGSVIVKFADIIARNCMDKRFAEELEKDAARIPVFSTQLSIIASVKAATPDDLTSNAGLVKNAENLMDAVIRTLKAAEAACVKGLNTGDNNDTACDKEAEEARALAMQWRRKLHRHRRIEASNGDMDHLGLRKIKRNISAPSLTEIVMT